MVCVQKDGRILPGAGADARRAKIVDQRDPKRPVGLCLLECIIDQCELSAMLIEGNINRPIPPKSQVARQCLGDFARRCIEWLEQDDGNGNIYYMHSITFETTWEKPKHFIPSQGNTPKVSVASTPKAPSSEAELLKDQTEEAVSKMEESPVEEKNTAAQAKPEATIKEEWVEVYDPVSESFYYYETTSKDVKWDAPVDYVMAANHLMMSSVIKIQCLLRRSIAKTKVSRMRRDATQRWVESTTEDTTCYYNTETDVLQDEKPHDFRAGATPDDAILGKIKLAMEGKLKKVDLEVLDKVKAAKAASTTTKWVRSYDPTSDAFYYYDATTDSTVWEQPEDFVETADDETMMAVVKIQCAFRSRVAREKAKELEAASFQNTCRLKKFFLNG